MASTKVNCILMNRNNIAAIHLHEGCTFAVYAMQIILRAHPCKVGFQEPVVFPVCICVRLVT